MILSRSTYVEEIAAVLVENFLGLRFVLAVGEIDPEVFLLANEAHARLLRLVLILFQILDEDSERERKDIFRSPPAKITERVLVKVIDLFNIGKYLIFFVLQYRWHAMAVHSGQKSLRNTKKIATPDHPISLAYFLP